jgi:metal transporter CNNM
LQWIISWPVAKILEFVLGEHHGIIYRRAELKELIALHSASATRGGDLKNDTVNIIGATLDLQEKEVSQVSFIRLYESILVRQE